MFAGLNLHDAHCLIGLAVLLSRRTTAKMLPLVVHHDSWAVTCKQHYKVVCMTTATTGRTVLQMTAATVEISQTHDLRS